MTMNEMLEQIGRATAIEKKPMSALTVLNEAYRYAKPSSFSRGPAA